MLSNFVHYKDYSNHVDLSTFLTYDIITGNLINSDGTPVNFGGGGQSIDLDPDMFDEIASYLREEESEYDTIISDTLEANKEVLEKRNFTFGPRTDDEQDYMTTSIQSEVKSLLRINDMMETIDAILLAASIIRDTHIPAPPMIIITREK